MALARRTVFGQDAHGGTSIFQQRSEQNRKQWKYIDRWGERGEADRQAAMNKEASKLFSLCWRACLCVAGRRVRRDMKCGGDTRLAAHS